MMLLDAANRALDELRFLAAGTISALLPTPENLRFAERHGLDPVPFSLVLGVVEAAAGPLLFFFGGLAYLGSTVGDQSMILLDNWWPGLTRIHVQGVGLLNWLAWLVNPRSWAFVLIALTGMTRIAAYVAGNAATGEPLAWLVVRSIQALRRWHFAAQRSATLGPPRPDRSSRSADGVLVILSSRERPEWSEAVTLGYEGGFFRLVGVREVRDGDYWALEYRFRETPDNEVIRSFVPYEVSPQRCAPASK